MQTSPAAPSRTPGTEEVTELIHRVVAQEVLPRWRALADDEVMEKAPGDLVTVADRAAEQAIAATLRQMAPQAAVIGEEATAADPTVLDVLDSAEHAFVIDPIDGTRNFVAGREDFAVMVAELRAGEVVRAWIHQPLYGRDFIAEVGSGSYVNGQRLTPPVVPSDPESIVALTARVADQGRRGRVSVEQSAWCCGVDYPKLLLGEAHALIYRRGMPWDHAPGSLLIGELGGVIRSVDESTYRPGRLSPSGLVAAASPEIAEEIVRQISQDVAGTRARSGG